MCVYTMIHSKPYLYRIDVINTNVMLCNVSREKLKKRMKRREKCYVPAGHICVGL